MLPCEGCVSHLCVSGSRSDISCSSFSVSASNGAPFVPGASFAHEYVWLSPFMFAMVRASVWMLSSGRVPGGLMTIASWYCRNPPVPGPLPGTTYGLDDQTVIRL